MVHNNIDTLNAELTL